MPITVDSLNTRCVEAEYSVRGGIPLIAEGYKTKLTDPVQAAKLPFKKLTMCNLGNPQLMGQSPITFYRQVVCLCQNPWLMKEHSDLFFAESIKRAKEILNDAGGHSMGAYTGSQGFPAVRRHVAEFIEKRDDLEPGTIRPENVFLTDGASTGIKLSLQLFTDGENPETSGFMIPVPQYPLYSATITTLGATAVPYFLREEDNWSISVEELSKIYDESLERGVHIHTICVINPGNPTGSVLDRKTIDAVIRFAHERDIVIMADEVYQENIYPWYDEDEEVPERHVRFHSFQRALAESPKELRDTVQLISYHSTSKGYIGECGARGGYFVLSNFSADVHAVFVKMVSICLCPNTTGQALVSCMVKPPAEGTDAYTSWRSERAKILKSLARRAQLAREYFDKLPNMSSAEINGALYAYPSIILPKRAVEKAEELGMEPDYYYCKRLLETTGVVVVPGSGFIQREGTWHFRCTILPPEDQFEEFLESMAKFHRSFLAEFE